MIYYKIGKFFLIGIVLLTSSVISVVAQTDKNSSDVFFYEKKELNTGFLLYANNEREELRTDNSRLYNDITLGSAAFQFKNSYWNFLDFKQDFLEFNFEIGPFYGGGNWIDSSSIENIIADQTQFGVRTNFSAHYATRFYYNKKNYTLVEVRGWARYDWFKHNLTGTTTDSTGVETDLDDNYTETKFRYGIEAKAGWGWGRLNPMNNYMLAQHILQKYYAGRNFSEKEIRLVADKVYEIKGERDIVTGHNSEIESNLIARFLNETMLLNSPADLETDWSMAEFMPRLNGSRIEAGPFFKYYNQEPDFIYGGYIQYKNSKYCSLKWNRDFSASINYNRYKKDDWILAELNIGWSYFPNLKKQYDFGIKYVPGISINSSSNSGSFNHGLVPYIGFFSQINSKARTNFTFAYRVSQDEKLMLSGPEFSLSFYWSRY